jgi:hypothetical protein
MDVGAVSTIFSLHLLNDSFFNEAAINGRKSLMPNYQYSQDDYYYPRSGHEFSCLRFLRALYSFSKKLTGQYLKLMNNRPILYRFQLIID